MFFIVRLISFVLSTSVLMHEAPEITPTSAPVVAEVMDEDQLLYQACQLESIVSFDAFKSGLYAYKKSNSSNPILTIVDFSLASDQNRFFVIDLEQQKLLCTSLVAHGQGTGLLKAEHFSNRPNSHQSSLGLYKVGQKIHSPKHGPALLLEGLDKGINDNARAREIIIHGADYVSHEFIRQNGRLGRSHGCPALPRKVMKDILPVIANGSLLYIYADIKS